MRPIVVQKQDETQTVVKSGADAARARGHHRLRAAHRRQPRLPSAAPTAPRGAPAAQRATPRGQRAAGAAARNGSSGGGSEANRDRNERLLPLHPPADRHLPAWRRGDAGRRARLLVAAGLGAAAGRFPHHPGHHAVAGRQSRHHRLAGDRAARAPVRPDPGAADHDLVEFVRHQPGHAAIRSQPRHRRRRAGRAVGDQRRRLDAAAQPALPAALFEGEPGRRADHHAGAHLADHRPARRSATWPTPSWRRGCRK